MRGVQQSLRESVQWPRGFRPKGHRSANTGHSFRQCDVGHRFDSSFQGSEDSVTEDSVTGEVFVGEKNRCNRPPASTTATPISAGNGLCIRISRATIVQPVRKTTGAAGYHQRRTGSLSRKRVVTDRARKHTAEKMM